ncbi:hypothetical protein F4780DRAFT_363471 [Xylariomycetidae sp. FL0641]|nr:hypothetical protein F4780DRAFT_363471 [Xylariomycetidae sp. FL0641]
MFAPTALAPPIPTREESVPWEVHIRKPYFAHAFVPLRGTEQERYEPIIERSKAEKPIGADRLHEVLKLLEEAEEKIAWLRTIPTEPSENGAPILLPRKATEVANVNGLRRINRYLNYPPPSRHERQYPACHKVNWRIPFANLSSVTLRRDKWDSWFMGHQPGNHICRLVDADEQSLLIDQSLNIDAAVDEVKLGSIFPDRHRLRYEGIVPFSVEESKQRFVGHVLPSFLTIIIAILTFGGGVSADNWRHKLLEKEMGDMPLGELECCMKALRRKWVYNMSELPPVIRFQIRSSMSRLAEVGWLAHGLRAQLPAWQKIFEISDWFMKAITGGGDLNSAADWYMENQLKKELTEKTLNDDLEDVLTYESMRKLEEVSQLVLFVMKEVDNRCSFSCSAITVCPGKVVCLGFWSPTQGYFSNFFLFCTISGGLRFAAGDDCQTLAKAGGTYLPRQSSCS